MKTIISLKGRPSFAVVIAMALIAAPGLAQIDPSILRPVGYHPHGVAYFNAPYFSNALHQGGAEDPHLRG